MPTKDIDKHRANNRNWYQRHAEEVKRKAAEYRATKRLSSNVSDAELDRRALLNLESMRRMV